MTSKERKQELQQLDELNNLKIIHEIRKGLINMFKDADFETYQNYFQANEILNDLEFDIWNKIKA